VTGSRHPGRTGHGEQQGPECIVSWCTARPRYGGLRCGYHQWEWEHPITPGRAWNPTEPETSED